MSSAKHGNFKSRCKVKAKSVVLKRCKKRRRKKGSKCRYNFTYIRAIRKKKKKKRKKKKKKLIMREAK